MNKIRVAVCDDIKQMRDYFSDIISAREDMEVVAIAERGDEIVQLAAQTKPDVILMDIQMESGRAGIDATMKITNELPEISIIILTVHDDDELIFDAFVAGAVDYLVKSVSVEDIFESITNAYNRNMQLNNRITQTIMGEFIRMKKERKSLLYLVNMMCNLSPGELETLQLLCAGMSRKRISEMRHVELVTVHTTVGRIMRKLGYKNSSTMIDDINTLGVLNSIKDMKK